MKQLLIVYHTQSGASAALARASLRGAQRESSVESRALRAWDAGVADLDSADGLLLVAAENSASVNGGMKDFVDRIFYPAIAQDVVIPYALIISAGNDGRGASAQMQRILSGIPLVPATEPLILRGEVKPAYLRQCEEQGEAMATGLSMGIF
jgi:NAD(P)H-dependent FMN reductase